MNIKRGEIWLANLDFTIGSEIQKTRPVVVVSNDVNNAHNNVVSVLPITSNVTKVFSFEVILLKGTANLPKDSKAKADQIRTLDKSRFAKRIGSLPAHHMSAIENAILKHLGIETR
jgi:mRNA interferase MazF